MSSEEGCLKGAYISMKLYCYGCFIPSDEFENRISGSFGTRYGGDLDSEDIGTASHQSAAPRLAHPLYEALFNLIP